MKKRESFSGALPVFLATLGSAVGLGNIWKFPGEVGGGGGGAFLLVYVLCLLLVGIPILLAEFVMGFTAKSNAVTAMDKLKVSKFWKIIGYMGMVTGYLILFFYTSIAGLVYSYVVKAVTGQFSNITPDQASQIFGEAATNPVSIVIWQVVAMAVVCTIIIAGVQKGIERVTKVLMPVLLLLLVICAVRALMLPAAGEGLRFLFVPDFSKITPPIVLSAMGLAFFKLSLGMGTMTTYASYFSEDTGLVKTGVRVAFSDLMVSLLAGLAIFPAIFSFGFEPTAGPALLFITIPMVFSQIPFGGVLVAMFFILGSIAATTAMISMLEVPVAYLSEATKLSRTKATLLSGGVMLLFGIPAALSLDGGGSLLGGIRIFGRTVFDFYDFISSSITMPLGGVLIAVLVGWVVNRDVVKTALSNNGLIKNEKTQTTILFVLRFVSTAAIILVFVTTLYSALFG